MSYEDRPKATICYAIALHGSGDSGLICNHDDYCDKDAKFIGDDDRFYCPDCRRKHKLVIKRNKGGSPSEKEDHCKENRNKEKDHGKEEDSNYEHGHRV